MYVCSIRKGYGYTGSRYMYDYYMIMFFVVDYFCACSRLVVLAIIVGYFFARLLSVAIRSSDACLLGIFFLLFDIIGWTQSIISCACLRLVVLAINS